MLLGHEEGFQTPSPSRIFYFHGYGWVFTLKLHCS